MKYLVRTGSPNTTYVGVGGDLVTDEYGYMTCSLEDAKMFEGKLPPSAFRPPLPAPKPAPKPKAKPKPIFKTKPAEKKSEPKKAAKPKKSGKK